MNLSSLNTYLRPCRLAVGFVAGACLSSAQTVIAPMPTAANVSGFARQYPAGVKPTLSRSSIASTFAKHGPLIKRGPVSVRPHFQYRALYTDGLQTNPGSSVSSSIQTIAPGVLFELGTRWTLDYTPTWTYYSSPEFLDTFGQALSLAGKFTIGDWRLGLSQSYSSNSETLVETSRQTHSVIHASAVSAAYDFGLRSSVELNASRTLRLANAETDAPEWVSSDWEQWSTSGWFNYKLSARLEVAAGVELGYSEVSVGSDFKSVRPQARMTWRPTAKITLNGLVGIDNVSFVSGEVEDLRTPTYNASLEYQPFDTTTLSLSANRSISASYFANYITRNTSWGVALTQRLLTRLFFAASYSYGTSKYIASSTTALSNRDDRSRSLNLSISTPVLRRGSISIIYHTAKTSSNESLYRFSSHQYGCEFGYRF